MTNATEAVIVADRQDACEAACAARGSRVQSRGCALGVFLFWRLPGPLAAQDWFRTGTGLGVSKPRVAVADFAPRNPQRRKHSPRCSATWCAATSTTAALSTSPARASTPPRCPAFPAELN